MLFMSNEEEIKKLDASIGLKDISHLDGLPAVTFKSSANNIQISEFLDQYDSGLIEYPKLQRNGVWSLKDQAELIESLIRGIPIPPVYINSCRTKDGKQKWEVLDGRQRITALVDFFTNNTVKINSNLPEGYKELRGYTFEEIEKANLKFAVQFKTILLPVIWLDEAPGELKREFFQKLNKGGKALSVGELAHSTLQPADALMASIMKTDFYKKNVHKTRRFAEYVPVSRVLHFILRSVQKDKTFVYNRPGLNGWKAGIITNTRDIQTDLDNLHESKDDEENFIPELNTEVKRVCNLIDEILGDVEIESVNNKLIINMLLALLILEDKRDAQAMTHQELKQAFTGLIKIWAKGHAPMLRQKIKTELANITYDEELVINECNKLESLSKTTFADVLENLRNDTYSQYA